MLEYGVRNQEKRGCSGGRRGDKGVLHLRQKVASEMSVSDDVMGDTHGHDICQSLYLVDHGICVGHLDSVIHTWDPVWSYHLVNLFMDFGWRGSENTADKNTGSVSRSQGWAIGLYLQYRWTLREQAMCVGIASLFLTPDTMVARGVVKKYSSDYGEACSLDP